MWLALGALAVACAPRLPWNRAIKTQTIRVAAAEVANDNSPVPLELVMVHDEALLKALLEMPAAKWFAEREQVRNDFPTGFDSRHWEIVPGQRLTVDELPFKRKGIALLVFAGYHSPGDHRARIEPFRRLRIELGEKEFTVGPVPQ